MLDVRVTCPAGCPFQVVSRNLRKRGRVRHALCLLPFPLPLPLVPHHGSGLAPLNSPPLYPPAPGPCPLLVTHSHIHRYLQSSGGPCPVLLSSQLTPAPVMTVKA